MAPFWGRYSCMSLHLVFMVTLKFISLQPLLAFVHQPLGLKCLVSPQKVARQKKDKFQTESLSYILTCLVRSLMCVVVKPSPLFTINSDNKFERSWGEKGCSYVSAWMLQDYRSSPPYFHTFFIVFEVVSPLGFIHFGSIWLRHTHGIHPPKLYTFAISTW